MISHTSAQNLFRLKQGLGDLVEAGNIILVMLNGVEGHREREIGQAGMNAPSAAGCTERHLVLFEVVVLDALLDLAEKQIVGDEVLLGKAGGIDGLDPRQVGKVALVSSGWCGQGVIAELVVVAVVADGRSQGRIHLERDLPGLVE